MTEFYILNFIVSKYFYNLKILQFAVQKYIYHQSQTDTLTNIRHFYYVLEVIKY